MPDFLAALYAGRILLMDGAMGTALQRAGIRPDECYELWNLTHPEEVLAIHRAYVEAGAVCLLTNSFQSNPAALARFGLKDQLENINHAAIQLARSAAGKDRFVLGSIGPMDLSTGTADLERVIRSLAEADALLLETWSENFALAVSRATDPAVNPRRLPVLLSLTFLKPADSEPPQLPGSGWTARRAAETVADLKIAALGANCGRDVGLEEMMLLLKDYRAATTLPLFCRPNAGTPVLVAGQWQYPRGAEQMAAHLPDLVQAGVRMIGGCCGTTPEHIQAFAAGIAGLQLFRREQ